MKKNGVSLFISLAVLILVGMFMAVNLNAAPAGSEDKADAWKNDSLNEIHVVRGVISDWIKAWQSKDLEGYMAYYSPEFRSEKLDYHALRTKKAELFKRPGSISVNISNLWVFIEGPVAKVRFTQEYADTYLSDVGEKHMLMMNSNGAWKIVSEEWKPLAR